MTNCVPGLLVAKTDRAVVVKITGRANFILSVPLKQLVAELNGHALDRLLFDLSECVTMDSTFLGVLASTALQVSGINDPVPVPPPFPKGEPRQLRLFKPSHRILELIENLGVAHLFATIEERTGVTDEQLLPAPGLKPSRQELSRTCLEAHQLLVNVHPENAAKFTDVTRYLSQDLNENGT